MGRDALQEVALKICETPDEELERIKSFKGWAFMIMRNFASKTGESRKYQERVLDWHRLKTEHYSTYNPEIDELANKAQEEIERLAEHGSEYWYEGMLFKEYIQEGTMRELSRQTKIPLTSISKTINETRDILKDRLDD